MRALVAKGQSILLKTWTLRPDNAVEPVHRQNRTKRGSPMGAIWWGTRGTCPSTFLDGGHNMPCPSNFFLFRFYIWRGFKIKSDVCHILCEEFFMLDGRPHIAKLMLKQSLVWYHWFCWFINFSFDKIIFSIFQVSSDRERWLTAFVRHLYPVWYTVRKVIFL